MKQKGNIHRERIHVHIDKQYITQKQSESEARAKVRFEFSSPHSPWDSEQASSPL